MSRVRSYLIGSGSDCDFVIDGGSVADRHAEATLLADGRYHITDRGSVGGTFVLRESDWQTIRQDFVEPGERLRFGDHEIVVDVLADLVESDVTPDRARSARHAQAPPAAPDPDTRLVRDPLTGEIVENAP